MKRFWMSVNILSRWILVNGLYTKTSRCLTYSMQFWSMKGLMPILDTTTFSSRLNMTGSSSTINVLKRPRGKKHFNIIMEDNLNLSSTWLKK